MNSLSTHKWVRVMADFCADGLWDKNGSEVGVEELPVSPELIERLVAWQSRLSYLIGQFYILTVKKLTK